MRKVLVLCLFALPLQLFAQYSIVAKDGNGKVLGAVFDHRTWSNPYVANQTTHSLEILVPGSIAVGVKAEDGAVGPDVTAYFESADCSGAALVQLWAFQLLADTIYYISGQIQDPPSLVLLPAGDFSQAQELTAHSMYQYDGTCLEYTSTTTFIPVDNYRINDPTKFGLHVVPTENGNRWGFLPPITVGLDKPQTIFCSGFESCPTQ